VSINILFEQLRKPNVYPCSSYRYMTNYWSPKYRCVLPREFHHIDDLNIVDLSSFESLDYFIYPIIVNEPYFVIRHFLNSDHPYGLFNRIDHRILEKINSGKGKIFVSMNSEPVGTFDFKTLVSNFDDSRVVFSINTSKYYKEGKFMTFPSWTEIDEFSRHKLNTLFEYLDVENKKPKLIDTGKRKFSLLNARYTKHPAAVLITSLLDKYDLFKYGHTYVDQKGINIVNDYESTKKYCCNAYKLSKFSVPPLKHSYDLHDTPLLVSQALRLSWFNIVVEAYYTNYMIEWPYITEKTFRCLRHNIPFVLIGQKGSLQQLHDLGYKTFSPFIDESYDLLEDDDRVFYAFNEIKKLCNMSVDQLNDLNNRFKPIYAHNQMNFQKRKQEISDYVRSLKVR
jgi:hypothetical protein